MRKRRGICEDSPDLCPHRVVSGRMNMAARAGRGFAWIHPSQQSGNHERGQWQAAWVDTMDAAGVFHLYLVGASGQTWQAVTSPGLQGTNNV